MTGQLSFILILGILSRSFSKECGGSIQSTISQIQSPGYPGRTSVGEVCLWNIEVASEEICHLEVEFVSGDLRNSQLRISSLKLTGSLVGIRLFPLNGNLSIKYEAGDDPGTGFMAILRQKLCTETASTQCGSVLKGLENSIIGLGHRHQNCYYLLEKSNTNICQLQIDFVKFELENKGDCGKNHLKIGEENLCNRVEGIRSYTFDTEFMKISSTNLGDNVDKFILKLKQLPCRKETELLERDMTAKDSSYVNEYSNTDFLFDRGFCCHRQFHSEQHFFLSSPGFPFSNTIDCSFSISRYSSRAVAFEIRFKYFWVGEKDQLNICKDGSIEIDGKVFCGCLTGLTWTVPFYNEQFKILRFKLDQINFNKLTGFVIEIFQIENYYFVPSDGRQILKKSVKPSFYDLSEISSHSTIKRESIPKQDLNRILQTESVDISSEKGNSTEKTARSQRLEMVSKISDFSCLSTNPTDWVLLLQQTVWAQLYCLSPLLPSLSTASNHLPEKSSSCSVSNKDHGWIHLSSKYRLFNREDNGSYCFRIESGANRCSLQITFHRADFLQNANCIDSYIEISGIGRICEPLFSRSSVRTDLRNGITEIVINRRNRDYILLEYQQLPCGI